MSYTIEHHPHGLIVRGAVPVDDLAGLMQIAKKRGWDIIDAGLSGHFSVCMVMTNGLHSKLWRIEIGLEEDDGMRPCTLCGKPARLDPHPEVQSICTKCMYEDLDKEPSSPLICGDLVKVTHQPPNQAVQIVGEVAVIIEIEDGYAHLQAIDIHGMRHGEGTVPLSCLTREKNPGWIEAKKRWKNR